MKKVQQHKAPAELKQRADKWFLVDEGEWRF